jgi:ribosome-associated toxin RatA of RatAB toxin-antitoxin module
MYELVNDVKSYPQFLPGCTGSRVLESGPTQMTAAVDVSKAGISKTFTTRNTLTANQTILMHLVDGPFKRLMGAGSLRRSRRMPAASNLILISNLPIS